MEGVEEAKEAILISLTSESVQREKKMNKQPLLIIEFEFFFFFYVKYVLIINSPERISFW